jgi:hypothetical protein
MRFSHLWRLGLALSGSALALRAQAAVEYALKSGQSALAADGSNSIGGCSVDSRVFSCLSRSHPKAAILVAILICLVLMRWFFRYGRSGSH